MDSNYGWPKLFIFWLVLLVGTTVNAAGLVENNDDATDKNALSILTVLPLTCVTQFKGDPCETTLKITWQQLQNEARCIYLNETLVKCFEERPEFPFRLKITMETTSDIRLVEPKHKRIIATQEVKVNFAQKRRRRLRPKWSIF
jgi:hypothetical protein